MQTLAYGGSRTVPFQQGICESQALEPGITGNFTRTQMQLLADATGCNKTTLDSNATIECLRSLDSATFAQASYDTYFQIFNTILAVHGYQVSMGTSYLLHHHNFSPKGDSRT